MVQCEITISGRVQGVGFRYFVRKKAIEIGIAGWVKNSRSGGVEVIAEGETAKIEVFIDWLKIGPSLGRVDKVIVNRFERTNNYKGFEIRY